MNKLILLAALAALLFASTDAQTAPASATITPDDLRAGETPTLFTFEVTTTAKVSATEKLKFVADKAIFVATKTPAVTVVSGIDGTSCTVTSATSSNQQEIEFTIVGAGCEVAAAGTFTVTIAAEIAANPAAGAVTCDVTTTTDVTAVAATAYTTVVPTLTGVTPNTIATNVASTLTFTATSLVNDATLPFFKIVASGVACTANNDDSDAIGTWAKGQVTYSTAIEATFSITAALGTAASTGNVVCWSGTSSGTYAQVGSAVMAVTVTAPTVTAVNTNTIATTVQAPLTFTTTNMVNGSEAWFKITATATACTAAVGDADAIGTWAAGKFTFVSAVSGTFAITAPYGFAASSDNNVCWSATKAGSYAAVGTTPEKMATTVGGGFSAQPTTSDITSSNVTITVTPGEDVNVKCGVFARNATAPTAAEVYAGTGTGGAAVNTTNGPVVAVATIAKNGASTAISGKIMGLTAITLYDVYCATNDATKVLSSPVVQFSTTAVPAAATTAAPAAATTTVSGASSEAAWSTMLTVFAIAMAAFSTL
jgi:hypothetical protein